MRTLLSKEDAEKLAHIVDQINSKENSFNNYLYLYQKYFNNPKGKLFL